MRIIPRAEWGARYARGFGPAPLPAREVWMHHSVTAAPNVVPPFDDDDAAIRLLESIGQERFGGGISYTFVITPSGRVYEGHGVDRVGAHTKNRNSFARAICLIGNYEILRPTAAQQDSMVALLQDGRSRGWWNAARFTGGHRDAPGASTSCPGKFAYSLIPTINQRAAGLAQEAELNAEEARMLADIHRETTNRLPNRRGPAGAPIPNGGSDTLLGYAANADGFGYHVQLELLPQILSALRSIETRLTALEQRQP